MEEWKEYKLGEFATFKTGKLNSNAAVENGCYPFFTCSPETLRINDYAFEQKAILLAGNNAEGNFNIKYYEGKFNAYQRTYVINPVDERLDIKFLYYALSICLQSFKRISQGTSTKFLTAQILNNFILNVPSLATQQKIANILSSLDDKIEVNRRINEQLEELAGALFKSWFVDFEPFKDGEFVESELGMIPKGWKVGNLLDVATLYDSMRKPLSGRERDAMEKIYPYYGATSIMDYVDKYIFDGIYLLMGEDGSVVDDKGFPILQYVWGKFWPNNHAHVMQGKNGFTTEMLHCLLSITNVKSVVTGAVQAKISQMGMKKIYIVIAPNELLEDFSMRIVPIYDKIRANSEEIHHLTTLRDTLLPKLMSGEIDVNEVGI